MEEGYKLHEIDDMDIHWFSDLMARKNSQSTSKKPKREVFIDEFNW